jgi:hypothetical protein
MCVRPMNPTPCCDQLSGKEMLLTWSIFPTLFRFAHFVIRNAVSESLDLLDRME